MNFKDATEIKFVASKNDEKEAILDAMTVNDAFQLHVPFNHDLKAWRNCAYRYSAKTGKQFSVKLAEDGNYYVVRIA